MQICEVHLDGFGLFFNKHFTGLNSGINVIYGANEFGKSTFLAFIRRILFGFPRSSAKTNPYPALSGGAYGGRLKCELDNGDIITIARATGPHGGMVTILKDTEELSGQEAVDDLLGHISGTFYENVYAFSLDELQEVGSLQRDEIKNRIYGAGLGLGSVSLTNIEKELRNHKDKIFKSHGSSQLMAKLYQKIKTLDQEIRNIQKGLSSYDELVHERDDQKKEVKILNKQIDKLGGEQQSLKLKSSMYPTYSDLVTAQKALSELDDVSDFPEDALECLEALKASCSTLKDRLKEQQESLQLKETQKDQLDYNSALIEQEANVVSLERLLEKYRSASRDKSGIQEQINNLTKQIQKEIKKINPNWTGEAVSGFDLTHLESDRIRTFREKIDTAKKRIESNKDKLDLRREQKAAESGKGWISPDTFKYAMYGLTIVGLSGLIYGIANSLWVFSAFTGLIFIIGGGVSYQIIRGTQAIRTEDKFEQTLLDQLGKANREYEQLTKEWREYLSSISLDKKLTPDGAEDSMKAIRDIQLLMKNRDDLESRLTRIQAAIDKVKNIYSKVTPCVSDTIFGEDIAANIEIISNQLEDAKNTKKDKEHVESSINEVSTIIKSLEESIVAKEKEIEEFISSVGASDEEDLKRKQAVLEKRKELDGTIQKNERIIRSAVGVGEFYERFIDVISKTTPEGIANKLSEVVDRLDALQSDRDQKIESVGELNNQIDNLSSSQDLLIKRNEMEIKKQQLRDLSQEWVKCTIAQVMFRKAISKYETTRQPAVVMAAESIFAGITNNRYPKIVKPAEGDALYIEDGTGTRKSGIEISRGTKEQLYFAMRLGLIEEYEKVSESMPIIMDDILVNFDDERAPLAIKAINEFSENRQIIVLTCHSSTLGKYKELGAHEVKFS